MDRPEIRPWKKSSVLMTIPRAMQSEFDAMPQASADSPDTPFVSMRALVEHEAYGVPASGDKRRPLHARARHFVDATRRYPVAETEEGAGHAALQPQLHPLRARIEQALAALEIVREQPQLHRIASSA